jgi:hypothetical protein
MPMHDFFSVFCLCAAPPHVYDRTVLTLMHLFCFVRPAMASLKSTKYNNLLVSDLYLKFVPHVELKICHFMVTTE